MAYVINAGDLRTPCAVEEAVTEYDSNAEPTVIWENVFGEGNWLWCAVEIHTEEREEGGRRFVMETATITTRFSPRVNERCRIYPKSEREKPYLIESAQKINHREGWMVIKATRRRAAL